MHNPIFRAISILALLMTTPVFAGPKEDAYSIVEKWSSGFNAFDAEQTAATYSPDAIVIGTFGKQLRPAPQPSPVISVRCPSICR